MPSAEEVQKELGTAKSMDDFFGREGIFARLFAKTMEQMLEAELSEQLGYEPYEVKGRNSGDSRNGSYPKKLRSSNGEVTIQVPRDRNGEFEPQIVKKHTANTNELEDKIIGMYAKGLSVRDVQDTLARAVWDGSIPGHHQCDYRQGVGVGGSLAKPPAGCDLPDHLPGCHSHQPAPEWESR